MLSGIPLRVKIVRETEQMSCSVLPSPALHHLQQRHQGGDQNTKAPLPTLFQYYFARCSGVNEVTMNGWGCFDVLLHLISLCSLLTLAFTNYKQSTIWGRGARHSSSTSSSVSREWPKIEWFYIPAGLGFALIGFLQFKHILKREQKQRGLTNSNNNGIDEENIQQNNNRAFVFSKWQV